MGSGLLGFMGCHLFSVLVFVAIVGSLLLNEKLHLGSIIGGLMIVYGAADKAKEMKQKTGLVAAPTADEESNETTEEDKQSEIKETDEEEETPHVIILP